MGEFLYGPILEDKVGPSARLSAAFMVADSAKGA